MRPLSETEKPSNSESPKEPECAAQDGSFASAGAAGLIAMPTAAAAAARRESEADITTRPRCWLKLEHEGAEKAAAPVRQARHKQATNFICSDLVGTMK